MSRVRFRLFGSAVRAWGIVYGWRPRRGPAGPDHWIHFTCGCIGHPGPEVSFQYQRHRPCPVCDGRGRVDNPGDYLGTETCLECGGSGRTDDGAVVLP